MVILEKAQAKTMKEKRIHYDNVTAYIWNNVPADSNASALLCLPGSKMHHCLFISIYYIF